MKNTVKTAQSAQAKSRPSSGTGPATEGRCNRTFVEAAMNRVSYPLKSGAYKLREARLVLEQQLETVKAIEWIAVAKSRPRPDELLGCCVAGERNTWLKSVPNSIAHILGYYVVPAVGALAGDGISAGTVGRILEHAGTESARLVTACDEVGVLINVSREHIDFAMRRSWSLLKSLLTDAIALVDATLPHPQKN